ncbi:MAG: ComEC/Rec2 family competence protein, partial [Actinomycetota bacterium]
VGHVLTRHREEVREPCLAKVGLHSGAAGLGERRRILFTGLVYGDDRGQDAGVEADFRQAGLTHLLAVSGQNVAYVLTLLRPLLERLALRSRWVVTMAALVVFATMTRFEPSVLRATMMAAIAVTATTAGRATSTVRNLALAVTALLVIDPLLAETAAFRLSVAASTGIAVFEGPIRGALRGPRPIRSAFAVTLAAQLAVAPVLMSMFGPMSVISLPANMLAGPVAGAVMAWGMTAGVVAGILPLTADPIHVVTRVLLITLETIASTAAAVPISSVGLDWVLVAVVTIGGAPWWRMVPGGRLATALLVGLLVIRLATPPAPGSHRVGAASTLTIAGGVSTLRLGAEYRPVDLVTDIRHLGLRSVDVVVTSDPGAVTTMLADRITVGRVATGE